MRIRVAVEFDLPDGRRLGAAEDALYLAAESAFGDADIEVWTVWTDRNGEIG